MGDVLTLPVAPRERLRELHSYRTAAGLEAILALDSDRNAPLPMHLAIIGPGLLGIEIIASFAHDTEGRETADKVAATVLRALQLAEWTCPGSAA